MPSPEFKSPLRPGHPPGYRRKPTHEVDEVLTECHWLAWEANGARHVLKQKSSVYGLIMDYSQHYSGVPPE